MLQGAVKKAHQVGVGEQVRQPAAAQVVRNLVWAAAAGHRHPHAQLPRLQQWRTAQSLCWELHLQSCVHLFIAASPARPPR